MPEDPPAPPPPPSALDRAFLIDQPGTGELVLVRHGQQRWPVGPSVVPDEWRDPPLSDLGRRQAETVGALLAQEDIVAVYTSDLERARETAKEIGRHHGLVPEEYIDLRELEMFRDVPAGSSLLDVIPRAVLRGARERFVLERSWDVYPLSEPSVEFRHRVLRIIEGILADHPGERVVVACHGGVINAYLGHVVGTARDMFFRPAHASVSRLHWADSRRVLHSVNETHHLSAVDAALVTF